mmetsp:Transcript_40145/g.108432  ORF Transcript_40145/g.108432 Transcript_40145/m.108432 type:complete len:321 (-) Transcript_40145:166-1128(-)
MGRPLQHDPASRPAPGPCCGGPQRGCLHHQRPTPLSTAAGGAAERGSVPSAQCCTASRQPPKSRCLWYRQSSSNRVRGKSASTSPALRTPPLRWGRGLDARCRSWRPAGIPSACSGSTTRAWRWTSQTSTRWMLRCSQTAPCWRPAPARQASRSPPPRPRPLLLLLHRSRLLQPPPWLKATLLVCPCQTHPQPAASSAAPQAARPRRALASQRPLASRSRHWPRQQVLWAPRLGWRCSSWARWSSPGPAQGSATRREPPPRACLLAMVQGRQAPLADAKRRLGLSATKPSRVKPHLVSMLTRGGGAGRRGWASPPDCCLG